MDLFRASVSLSARSKRGTSDGDGDVKDAEHPNSASSVPPPLSKNHTP